MKRAKHERLIRAAFESMRPTPTYATLDIVTGLEDGPEILAVPIDLWDLQHTTHQRVDLPEWGFRLVRIEEASDARPRHTLPTLRATLPDPPR